MIVCTMWLKSVLLPNLQSSCYIYFITKHCCIIEKIKDYMINNMPKGT